MFGSGMYRGNSVDTYQQHFSAYPAAFVENSERIDGGGKILLPSSCLAEMSTMNLSYPLQFKLQSHRARGRESYCGVLEFTAPEGQAVLPAWMFHHLLLEPGDTIRCTTVILPRGDLVKLRPQAKRFIELSNPKSVLEAELKNYSVLTKGETVAIRYLDEVYHIDILETKVRGGQDADAISIIDTELRVEFDRPLDMPESPKREAPPQAAFGANVIQGQQGLNFAPVEFKPPTLTSAAAPPTANASAKDASAPQQPSFSAFGGSGRSLSGKPLSTAPQPQPASSAKEKDPAASGAEPTGEKFEAFKGKGRSMR